MPTLPSSEPGYLPLTIPWPPLHVAIILDRARTPPEVSAWLEDCGLPALGLAWVRVHIDARKPGANPRATLETVGLPLQRWTLSDDPEWRRWAGYQLDLLGLRAAKLPDPAPDWPHFQWSRTDWEDQDKVIVQIWSVIARHGDSRLGVERRWHPRREPDDSIRCPRAYSPTADEQRFAWRGLAQVQHWPMETRGRRRGSKSKDKYPTPESYKAGIYRLYKRADRSGWSLETAKVTWLAEKLGIDYKTFVDRNKTSEITPADIRHRRV